MMQLAELQAVATNIVVISVALLAVAIIMFSASWQGLFNYIGLLSVEGRRDIATMIFWSYVFFATVFGVYIAMAYWGPNLVRIFVFLVLFVFSVVEIVYLVFIFVWNIVRHRRLPRLRRSKEPDVEEWEKAGMLAYSTSVFNMVLAVFSFAVSLLTAMDATVGTGIRSNPSEDVDFSRWTLLAGTMAFFIGLMLLGAGRYVDLYRLLGSKVKAEEVRDSDTVDSGQGDQD